MEGFGETVDLEPLNAFLPTRQTYCIVQSAWALYQHPPGNLPGLLSGSNAVNCSLRWPFPRHLGERQQAVGQTIDAGNFDVGGEGVAFHNPGPVVHSNPGYRTDADISLMPDGLGGNAVGPTVAGEWMNYTLMVPAAGQYVLSARVACAGLGAKFHALFRSNGLHQHPGHS